MALIIEYKDKKAFTKGQELIAEIIAEIRLFFKKINLKRTSSRSINLLDFYD